jgi:ubiquinol oxidase
MDEARPLDPMPKLSPEALRAAQRETLDTPRRTYSIAARLLFAGMDLVYGTGRDLQKFKVLELIARVPYQAWENVAYVAVTHRAREVGFARRVFDRVTESRRQQDNEQWHLLILAELIDEAGQRPRLVRHRLLPQLIAFAYYQLSWFLFAVRPRWSYRLNADFEDHAEHEYARFVEEHPELERVPYDGVFAAEYGRFESRADLFRQISHDERVHKLDSIARMAEPRFR